MILHPELLLGQINEHHRELIAEAEQERLFQAIKRRLTDNNKAQRAREPVISTRAKHA